MANPGGLMRLICYDLWAISVFFRSCALAAAFQRHTTMQWVTYRDSVVINAIYTVMFWKEPPGTAEVRVDATTAIEKTTDEIHEQYLLRWLRILHEKGPAAAAQFVDTMAELREYNRRAVQDLIRDASQINAEVAHQTQDALVTLARIRLGATVGVAAIGAAASIAFVGAAAVGGAGGAGVSVFGVQAGASAGVFSGLGLGYSMANSLAKSSPDISGAWEKAVTGGVLKQWEEGAKATVAAVHMDLLKFAGSEGGGRFAGMHLDKALAQQARSKQIINSAMGEIRKQSAALAQKGLSKKATARATSKLHTQATVAMREASNLGAASTRAAAAAAAGKAIPVVFAAWDIIDAWGDYLAIANPDQK